MTALFKDLGDWDSTKNLLHEFSRVISAVPRKYAPHHPRWWHISLKVQPSGLWLDPVVLPDGSGLILGIRMTDHKVVLHAENGHERVWSLTGGMRPTGLAEELFSEVSRHGLSDLDPTKFKELADLDYQPLRADRYFDTIRNIDRIFKLHRSNLDGDVGPVQLWPHGFDIAFEWFGSKTVEYEENGETSSYRSQLNLGWSPGEPSHPEPYFYSNPWPFDESITENSLPEGASWFNDSWQGSILPYSNLIDDPHAEARLLEYAQTVFNLVMPTLSDPGLNPA